MDPRSLGLIDQKDILRAAQSLPPLSNTLIRLVRFADDPEASIGDIVAAINLDQALTAALLRQANSAAWSSSARIGSVHDAVVRLGMGTVLSTAFSLGVSRHLNTAVPEYGLGPGELWHHSVIASLAAESIRARSPFRVSAETATAALLHDIGKLVLSGCLGPNVLRFVATKAADDGMDDWEAEAEILQVHHGEVGAMVVRHWLLPSSIAVPILHHHTPELSGDPTCHAVALASIVADHLEAHVVGRSDQGEQDDAIVAPLPELPTEGSLGQRIERSSAALRLSTDALNKVAVSTLERFDEVSARFLDA